MSVYAIADLHLSLAKDKPMDIFGENWTEQDKKIQKNWKEIITNDDTVLVAGDISWAISMAEFQPDFEFLRSLPGKKVFISGNHDYWWTSVQKLNTMDENMFFIRTNFYAMGDTAVCGTRGWVCPNDTMYTAADEKIYKRECGRLELSLQAAKKVVYGHLHSPEVHKTGIKGVVNGIEYFLTASDYLDFKPIRVY